MTAVTDSPLRPGDPPPFWQGYWHPQGLPTGGVEVSPRGASAPAQERRVPAAAAAEPVAPAAAIPMPAAPAAEVPALPAPAAEAAAIALPAAPVVEAPVIALPAAPAPEAPATALPAAAPSARAATAPPSAPPQPARPLAPVLARLADRAPLVRLSAPPAPGNREAALALAGQARQLAQAKQGARAVQALEAALAAAPGEAALYAQAAQLLWGLGARPDALATAAVAQALAPQALPVAELAIGQALSLGQLGWAAAFVGRSLAKHPEHPYLSAIGRWTAQAAGAPGALRAAYCFACKRPSAGAPGPLACSGCAKPLGPGAPVQRGALKGAWLARSGPAGRLVLAADCPACARAVPLAPGPRGPACARCETPLNG